MMSANPGGKQIEFDVFPKQDKSDYSYLSGIKEERNTPASSVNLVLSTQSIIILFICLLMLLVASFTLGVEKGRLTAANAEPVTRETPSVARDTAAVEKTMTPPAEAQNNQDKTQKIQFVPEAAPAEKADASLSGYAIQVASLKSESSAKGLRDTLTKKGHQALVKPSGSYQVVLVGGFTTKDEAQGKLRELKKTYPDSFIRKI